MKCGASKYMKKSCPFHKNGECRWDHVCNWQIGTLLPTKESGGKNKISESTLEK